MHPHITVRLTEALVGYSTKKNVQKQSKASNFKKALRAMRRPVNSPPLHKAKANAKDDDKSIKEGVVK